MNSKVIRWFKRQASIRRLTEKSDDKLECAQNNTEEKRKRSFPRLSFRRRNKKKTSSASDIEGNLAVVGISKRFSQSMPQEMESETRNLPTSNSAGNPVSAGDSSLNDSPTKTDGYRSVSELSYHSSFDYSRETNESLSLGEKQSTIAEINEDKEKELSDSSKPSTYDNVQTFHSVGSSFTSIIKDQPSSPPFYSRTANAPIVKMEEICDTVSDKEHPVEILSDNKSITSTNSPVNENKYSVIIHNDSDCILPETKASTTAESGVSLIKKDKENNEYLDTDFETNNNHSKNINNELPNTQDVFEEIDRLVRNASSLIEDEEVETVNGSLSVGDSNQKMSDVKTFHEANVDKANDLEEHLTILKIVEPHDSENVFKSYDSFGNISSDECSKNVETCLENLAADEHDDAEIERNVFVKKESLSEKSSPSNKITEPEAISTSNLYPNLQTITSLITPEPEIALPDTETDPKLSVSYVSSEPEAMSCLNIVNECVSHPMPNDASNITPKKPTYKYHESPQLEIPSSHANNDSEMNVVSVHPEPEVKVTSIVPEHETNGSCINNVSETPNFSINPVPNVTYVLQESESNLSQTQNLTTSEFSGNAEPESTNHTDSVKNRLGETPPFELTIYQSSPKKQESKVVHISTSDTSLDRYPKELNPFGDDSDTNDENPEVAREKVQVTRCKENGIALKENNSNRFSQDTNVNQSSVVMNSKDRSCRPKCEFGNAGRPSEHSSSSLNPFGDSDIDEEPGSPFDPTNPFSEEQQWNKIPSNNPPRLPPKSGEYQKRKTSGGSLAPIPHPRRSKQSHHGSYTSLQNVSTIPVPAPRSITPSGSSRTLNETALNPFDDDAEEDGDFNRQGLGRCSMQASGSSYSVQDPFVRSDVRGSLPPSSRFKVRTKKRQAPQPPGVPRCKPPPSPSDPKMFSSLPRKRASTSPASDFRCFDKKSPTTRENSPHRVPPPRPPPPKI